MILETSLHAGITEFEQDEEHSVRVVNPEKENGFEQEPGPLTWLSSARIEVDPDDDAVHCVVSVGDPRDGFCMTVRCMPDGGIILSVPHPDHPMPHMATRALQPGILIVMSDCNGKELDFSDKEPEE